MLAAIEQQALWNVLANHNLTLYELPIAYTRLLDGLEIKPSKRSEFLGLVQDFLTRNDIGEVAGETEIISPVGTLVDRFVYVWGRAVWGNGEFSDVVPASCWTYECQRVTQRLLGANLYLLFTRMLIDFACQKMVFFQSEDGQLIQHQRLDSGDEKAARTPLSLSQLASLFASHSRQHPLATDPNTCSEMVHWTTIPAVSRVSMLGNIIKSKLVRTNTNEPWTCASDQLIRHIPAKKAQQLSKLYDNLPLDKTLQQIINLNPDGPRQSHAPFPFTHTTPTWNGIPMPRSASNVLPHSQPLTSPRQPPAKPPQKIIRSARSPTPEPYGPFPFTHSTPTWNGVPVDRPPDFTSESTPTEPVTAKPASRFCCIL